MVDVRVVVVVREKVIFSQLVPGATVLNFVLIPSQPISQNALASVGNVYF